MRLLAPSQRGQSAKPTGEWCKRKAGIFPFRHSLHRFAVPSLKEGGKSELQDFYMR